MQEFLYFAFFYYILSKWYKEAKIVLIAYTILFQIVFSKKKILEENNAKIWTCDFLGW